MKSIEKIFFEVKNLVIDHNLKLKKYEILTKEITDTMLYWEKEGNDERFFKCAEKLSKYSYLLEEIQSEKSYIKHQIENLPKAYRRLIYHYYI